MKKISLLLLATMLVFSFVACSDDDSSTGGVTFVNKADSKLRLTNNDAVRLVAFKGIPSASTYIGGVEAQTTTGMDVAADGQLSVVYCVRYTDYQSSKYSAPIVSSVMVFLDPENAGTYDVSPSSIGDAKILVDNQTKYYVELRKSTETGDLWAIFRPWEKGTKSVPSGEVDLFVILKGAVRTSISNPVPKIISKVWYEGDKPKVFTRNISASELSTFTVASEIELDKLAIENVVISLINHGNNGGRLLKNSSGAAVMLAKGGDRYIINPGSTDAYYFTRANYSATTFDASAYVFKIDSTYYTMPAEAATLKVGYEYTITVPLTGTACTVHEDGKIDPTNYETAQ